MKVYKNRYGREYSFVQVDEKTYMFKGDMDYCRCAGTDDNLSFIDPSGGPFMSIGFYIEGQPVEKIYLNEGKYFFEVNTSSQ